MTIAKLRSIFLRAIDWEQDMRAKLLDYVQNYPRYTEGSVIDWLSVRITAYMKYISVLNVRVGANKPTAAPFKNYLRNDEDEIPNLTFLRVIQSRTNTGTIFIGEVLCVTRTLIKNKTAIHTWDMSPLSLISWYRASNRRLVDIKQYQDITVLVH